MWESRAVAAQVGLWSRAEDTEWVLRLIGCIGRGIQDEVPGSGLGTAQSRR